MSDLNIVGIEEIMISHFDIEKKYFLKIKSEELEKLIYSKFENSFRAYNIDENKFKLEGKKKIKSSLSYKEKNYLGEIKKGMVRIVTWEILQNTNAYINEFPETLKEIDLRLVLVYFASVVVIVKFKRENELFNIVVNSFQIVPSFHGCCCRLLNLLLVIH